MLCLGAGLAAVWPAGALSETLTRSFSYFTIGGVTPEQIEQQLVSLGPSINGSVMRHPGATRMKFTSHITYSRTAANCRIAAAGVSIDAKVILPRWRRTTSADAASRLYWDALSADIVRHEESHLVIARNHARELERGLVKLPAAASCEEMAAAAQALQDKVLARHDAEQQRFDRIEARTLDKRLLGKLKRRMDALADRP